MGRGVDQRGGGDGEQRSEGVLGAEQARLEHAGEEGGGEGERADRHVLRRGEQQRRVRARGRAHVQLEQPRTW